MWTERDVRAVESIADEIRKLRKAIESSAGQENTNEVETTIQEKICAMFDIIKEVNWYFSNMKLYCIPPHYLDCMKAAVRYAAKRQFNEASELIKCCKTDRIENGAE